MSRRQPTLGVVVLDSRISLDTLAPKGATDTTCAYTESGPGPGHAVLTDGSAWRPQVSQAQSVGLTLRAARGGYPVARVPGGGDSALRDGARVLYRLESDTGQTDYRSWDEPVLVTGWSAPSGAWGGSQVWTAAAATVITETGVVVVVAVDASANAQTWSWDPRTGVWTELYDWDAGALDGLDDAGLGLAYYDGRLILWSGASYHSRAYTSTDGGTTWRRYSDSTLSSTGPTRVCVDPTGGDWLGLALSAYGATGTASFYASSDQGVTWEVVGSGALTNSVSEWPTRTRTGYTVAYIDTSTDSVCCRRLASARSPIEDAAEIVIDSSRNYEATWIVTDDDGTVYVYARGLTADGISDEVWCWYSLDDGQTWQAYDWQVWATADTTRYLEPLDCVASGGRIHMLATPIGSTQTDGTVQVVSLGGWAQIAAGSRLTDTGRRYSRHGYARWLGTRLGDLYLPIAMPDNLGWTASTSTGTRSLSGTTPGLELTTTAGQGEIYRAVFTGADRTHCAGEAALQVHSDSSTLATIGTSNTGVSVLAVLRDGSTYSYAGQIDIGRDGIQVRDGTTIRATTSFTVSDDVVRIRWHMTKGQMWVYYAVGVVGTAWTLLAAGVTITNAGGVAIPFADDALIWGLGTSATGHATWLWVGGSSQAAWQRGIDTLSEEGEGPDARVVGLSYGGPLPARGGGYPIPDGTAVGESLALVAASGRCYTTEVAGLPVQYTYPIGALHPSESPDPRRSWRSTSRAAIQLVWDQGADQSSWWGGAVALVAIGVAPRRWVLERSDDGVTWTELGELDLEVGTDLTYTRVGRTLSPATTTDSVARYFGEGELVGGHVALGTGGLTETDVRRIARQSAGYWAPASAGVQQVRLELEGIDGTEASTGSTMALATASGVLICYPTADSPTRYLRVTTATPPPPTTVYGSPDVYYAGILGIGRVLGLGLTPAWGWTQSVQLERQVSRALDGVPSIRRSGPSRRRLSYSWPDGIPLEPLRLLASSPDWVGASGASPIGTWLDPAYSVAAVAELLESGQVPGVLIRRLPTTTSTITDPTQWVYGLLDVGSVTVTGIAGTEGTSEVVSVSALQLEELPWR